MEKRYAILIGINDYQRDSLNYCVNDAQEVKKTLTKYCRFNEENIHLITSDSNNPIDDLVARYKEAIRKINNDFKSEKDLLFFYFAGHGFYKEEQSNVMFKNNEYPINEIFSDLERLTPKTQIYIIDSCQSGGKVLTRSSNKSQSELIDKFIKNSSGAMLMYACRHDECASEIEELGHGILTYHFIETLKNGELYDNNVLTLNSIQDHVSKETLKSSDFTQTPVIENRVSGYYPFAFFSEVDDSEKTRNIDSLIIDRNENIAEKTVENIEITSIYSKENREIYFEALTEWIDNKIQSCINNVMNHFEIHDYDDLDDVDMANVDKIIESIVIKSEDEVYSPIYDIFKKKVINNESNKGSNNLLSKQTNIYKSLFNVFDKKEELKYEYEINSRFNDSIYTNIKILESVDVNVCSAGIGALIYQAKWGIVLVTIHFQINWNGYEDSEIKNLQIKYRALGLNETVQRKIEKIGELEFENLAKKIETWSKNRKNEIEFYL